MNGFTKVVAWVALVLAIASLAIAWTAYNRSGTDLEQELQQNFNEFSQEFEIEMAQLEARTELLALRAQIATEENYEQVASEVADIRQELAAEYQDASVEVRQEFNEIDAQFENLEQNLRNESAEALQSLQNLIEILQRDVRTDER